MTTAPESPGEILVRPLLERNAAEAPDELFVLFEDGSGWTRTEGLESAYRAANALRARGVGQGDRVGIMLPNGPDFLGAWWGAQCLGATVVPINVAMKGSLLAHIVALSEMKTIVVAPDLADVVASVGPPLTTPDALTKGDATAPVLDRPIEPWDVHAVVFTSGTTGPSKGSLNSNYQTFLTGAWCLMDWKCDADDVFQIDLPLFHNAALSMAGACLASRTRLAIRSMPAMSSYWATAKENKATIGFLLSAMVPFLLRQPESPADRQHSMRLMISSPLPDDVDAFRQRFGVDEVITAYGSTEVSGCLTRSPGQDIVRGYCGRVRQGYECRVVDEHDHELPAGEIGELIVRTDEPWMLTSGYVGNPDATAQAWRNGWFHTGDLLRADADGNHFFVDRTKDALRRRGENISSAEVEAEVASHPTVAEVACVAHPAEVDDDVKVFLVAAGEGSVDFPALLEYLIDRMPYFMVPRYFELVDALPKTATNKVQKHDLRARGNSDATWDREAHGYKVTRHGLARPEQVG